MRESGSEGGPLCADKENGFGGRGGALKAERPLKSGLDQRQGTDPTGSDRWASVVAVQCGAGGLATQVQHKDPVNGGFARPAEGWR